MGTLNRQLLDLIEKCYASKRWILFFLETTFALFICINTIFCLEIGGDVDSESTDAILCEPGSPTGSNICLGPMGYNFYIVQHFKYADDGANYIDGTEYDLIAKVKSGVNIGDNKNVTKEDLMDYIKKNYKTLINGYVSEKDFLNESNDYAILVEKLFRYQIWPGPLRDLKQGTLPTVDITGSASVVTSKIFEYEKKMGNKLSSPLQLSYNLACLASVSDPYKICNYDNSRPFPNPLSTWCVDHGMAGNWACNVYNEKITIGGKKRTWTDHWEYFANVNSNYGYGIFWVKDIKPPAPTTGTLVITKEDELKHYILDTVTFNIYKGNSCTGTPYKAPTFDHGITYITLPIGNYSVKEVNPPSGYNADPTCHQVNIDGKNNVYLNVKNEKTCISEFNSIDKTNMLARVNLYQKYPQYTNLLDVSKTNATDACSRNTSCNNLINVGCLSATQGNNFSSTNMSCYTSTITLGTIGQPITGYCQDSYSLTHNLSGSYQYTRTYNFGSSFKSGMMVLNRDFTNRFISKGKVTKTCFVYNTAEANKTGTSSVTESKPFNSYSSYVEKVEFNNEVLYYTETKSNNGQWIINRDSRNSLSIFTKEIYADYELNPVYALNGSGELLNSLPCPGNACKLLGYGFASKLNLATGTGYSVPFSIKFKDSSISTSITSNACKYGVTGEIVRNGKLNLSVRIIDSNNPFPGISGNGRDTKTNWCYSGDCSNNNTLVTDEILNSNDSYNKTGSGAIYTITLTPDIIKKIRTYNDTHNYDDYTLTCDPGGTNCESSFLRSYGITHI